MGDGKYTARIKPSRQGEKSIKFANGPVRLERNPNGNTASARTAPVTESYRRNIRPTDD